MAPGTVLLGLTLFAETEANATTPRRQGGRGHPVCVGRGTGRGLGVGEAGGRARLRARRVGLS